MLIYILKSAACLAILLVFYKLFLEKENMHVFKRFYLLGSLLFALIVPTIVFSEYVVVEPQIYDTTQSAVMIETEPNIPVALESDITDIAPLLWIVYFLGMLFFGIKFLRNLFQIYRRIRRNPKYKNSSFIQVLLQEKIPPHTFFKYIFLNQSKFESKEIPKEVILHEETHARQKHSLDVVFIELLQVIFWVNPLIYFFKKAIKLNHEFLADSAVLNKDVDAVTYQNTLLSFLSSESAKKYQPTLPNAINYSSIKKRFTIMKSKTSKKSIVLRSFLLLPLLTLLLAGFTEIKRIEIAPEFEIPVIEKMTSTENLQILINNQGQIRIENELVSLEDLDSFLVERNQSLLEKEGTKTMRAQILVEKKSPVAVIADVERILTKYGVAQIDIWGPENIPPADQKGATKEQLSKYNSLAKKYNSIPQTDRVIPMEDLKTLEQVFRKMTDSQKKDAQPFPECPQDGATEKQVAEYNALAKKYNSMLEENHFTIRKYDVDRLEYIHSLMSEEQRDNSEPFPDFPEPPEPPMPPNSPDEEEIIELEREMVRQERAMKEQEGAMLEQERTMKEKEHAMKEQEGAMEEQEIEAERQERIMEEQEVEMERRQVEMEKQELEMEKEQLEREMEEYDGGNGIPIGAFNVSPGSVHVMAAGRRLQEGIDYTVNYQAGTVQILDPSLKALNTKINISVEKKAVENVKLTPHNISVPPPPPTPESPLDHVIEMAKKNATFYYEGKKISSDKAIEIIKNNNEINIHSTGGKSKKPVVKLSTKPIKLGSTHNIKEKTKNKLQKVALVSLQSNESIEADKILMRLKEFSKSFRNCTEYYFEGQPISEKEAMHIYVNDHEIKISRDDSRVTGLVAKC